MKKITVRPSELARHLGFSPQHVTKLLADGVISRLSNGRFDQDICRLEYINWLRDPARRAAKSEAASQYHLARTQEIKLRNAEREGNLVQLEEACAVTDKAVGALRSALGGLASRVTRDLELRRRIEHEIRDALNTAANVLDAQADDPTAAAAED